MMNSLKITAIHSGGDWADACANYVILPDGTTIENESIAWRHWYNTTYVKGLTYGPSIKYKTLVDFILERGGRIPRDDELEVFTDD